jgi:tRNA-specific 2-thiouridylase
MARLLAAMSGGVDSSVAAALALEAGHEVVGVTLKQWEAPDEETRLTKGCCTLDAVADARRACELLGMPHYTFDFREIFARVVVDPWVDDYARGLTPNPCVRCNELVRFGALMEKAERLGFDGLVTGHWARAEQARLFRARNADKDQSYVLYALSAQGLERAHFPLGEIGSKAEVRSQARDLGLANWDRDDSVEVCFVGEDRRPADVVAEHRPESVTPGVIVDRDGNVVGRHKGLAHYTVGQRRGLGPVALGSSERRYVTALLPDRNALVVDTREGLSSSGLLAARPRFVSGERPSDGVRFDAVVRYRGARTPARFVSTDDGFELSFEQPATSVAPGQAVVLYDADEVVGGGTIVRRIR